MIGCRLPRIAAFTHSHPAAHFLLRTCALAMDTPQEVVGEAVDFDPLSGLGGGSSGGGSSSRATTSAAQVSVRVPPPRLTCALTRSVVTSRGWCYRRRAASLSLPLLSTSLLWLEHGRSKPTPHVRSPRMVAIATCRELRVSCVLTWAGESRAAPTTTRETSPPRAGACGFQSAPAQLVWLTRCVLPRRHGCSGAAE